MPRSLFSVHPRILMDLPRPPPRLIPRSPWNFYQFLSSDVPRSSFLKFPEDPDDSSSLFLHRIFIVFLRDCLPYSSLFLSPPPRSYFLHLLFSSSVRDRSPATRLVFITASSMPGFSADLFVSRGLSLSFRFFSRVFVLPSPTR